MRHLPVVLILAIYLPGALFGHFVIRDEYTAVFLVLLVVFLATYYTVYPRLERVLHTPAIRERLWCIGDRLPWRGLAWAAVAVYLASICAAAITTEITPLGAALEGRHELAIAEARARFLADREGAEALLRYAAVILGRSVLPFLVTYLYWTKHKARHVGLASLLLVYLVSLEKASPVFVFLPLIMLHFLQHAWRPMLAHGMVLLLCIGLWTFLAIGSLYEPHHEHAVEAQAIEQSAAQDPSNTKRRGDPERFDLLTFVLESETLVWVRTSSRTVFRSSILLSRIVWIPYITAHDWLKFQDEVLGGGTTQGRSIGLVSWMLGEPKVQLERMVYEYQFGASPGGVGGSNTVFFVDAKLAFGWFGVLAYCALFTAIAAAILSSGNEVAVIASITSFFTAAVSSLTATLLSGGMFFYLVLALLIRPQPSRWPDSMGLSPGKHAKSMNGNAFIKNSCSISDVTPNAGDASRGQRVPEARSGGRWPS